MISDLLIEPAAGDFDVAEVAAFLEAQPFVARDVVRAEMFMLADDAATLAAAQQARVADPVRFPSSVILVELRAPRIEISCRTARAAPARRFVDWLQARYQVRFLDEERNDLTSHARDPSFLFG